MIMTSNDAEPVGVGLAEAISQVRKERPETA